MKKVLLNWLPRMLGMERPGIKPPKKCVKRSQSKCGMNCGRSLLHKSGKDIDRKKKADGKIISPPPATIIPYVPEFNENVLCLDMLTPAIFDESSLYDHEVDCAYFQQQTQQNGNGKVDAAPDSKLNNFNNPNNNDTENVIDEDLDASVSITDKSDQIKNVIGKNGAMPMDGKAESRSGKATNKTSSSSGSNTTNTGKHRHKKEEAGNGHHHHDEHHHIHHQYMAIKKKHKMLEIMVEMKFITDRLRKEDYTKELIAEWRYAATVLDRLCLLLFTVFTSGSLIICLISAPQLIV